MPLHLTSGVGASAWTEMLEGRLVLEAVARELGLTLPELVRRTEDASMAEVAFTIGVPRNILVASIATALWAALTTGTRAVYEQIPPWLWKEADRVADRKKRDKHKKTFQRRQPRYAKKNPEENGWRLDQRG